MSRLPEVSEYNDLVPYLQVFVAGALTGAAILCRRRIAPFYNQFKGKVLIAAGAAAVSVGMYLAKSALRRWGAEEEMLIPGVFLLLIGAATFLCGLGNELKKNSGEDGS
jgi:hypothetical protein